MHLEIRIAATPTIAKRPCVFNLLALLRPSPKPMMLGLGATGTFGFTMVGEEAGGKQPKPKLNHLLVTIKKIKPLKQFDYQQQKKCDLPLEKLENQMNPEGKTTLEEKKSIIEKTSTNARESIQKRKSTQGGVIEKETKTPRLLSVELVEIVTAGLCRSRSIALHKRCTWHESHQAWAAVGYGWSWGDRVLRKASGKTHNQEQQHGNVRNSLQNCHGCIVG
ncbi:hypothetical protein V6N12_067978 [Hibiscus sabdariffa]|uniref:Uncharacterized protein n=1 Tax=Hibiscus sabdariffa TaxID=183260 RepID=A0ABR2FNR5_9ROSI